MLCKCDLQCMGRISRICKSSMSCNGVTIASHLLNNHKLTIGDYEKSYLSASSTEDQVEGQEEEEEQQLQQQQQQGYMLYIYLY